MAADRTLRGRGAGLVTALAAVLAATACGEPAANAGARAGGGSTPHAAPANGLVVTTTDTAGVVAWLATQRGKPVLLNCWATWCAPCVAELPDLLAGTRTFREQGGVVVGVAFEQVTLDVTNDQAVAQVTAKARELQLDFPVLVCTDDEMKTIRRVLGVELGGLPQTLTYDRAGKLVQQHEGMADAATFAQLAAGAR